MQFQLSSRKIAHGIGMKADSQEAAWPYTQGTTVLWAEVFPLLLTEQILTTILGKSPSDDNCYSWVQMRANLRKSCSWVQSRWSHGLYCINNFWTYISVQSPLQQIFSPELYIQGSTIAKSPFSPPKLARWRTQPCLSLPGMLKHCVHFLPHQSGTAACSRACVGACFQPVMLAGTLHHPHTTFVDMENLSQPLPALILSLTLFESVWKQIRRDF